MSTQDDLAERDRLAKRQRRNDAIFALAMIAFAALMAFVVIPAGVRVPRAVTHLPLSPRFFPNVLVGMVFVFALSILVMSVAGPPPLADEADGGTLRRRWALRLGALAAVLVGYIALPEQVGMLPVAIIATVFLLALGGERRVSVLIGAGVVVPVLLYVVFIEVFNVPMPPNPWLDWR